MFVSRGSSGPAALLLFGIAVAAPAQPVGSGTVAVGERELPAPVGAVVGAAVAPVASLARCEPQPSTSALSIATELIRAIPARFIAATSRPSLHSLFASCRF